VNLALKERGEKAQNKEEPISSSRTTQQKNPHSQSLFSSHNNNYSFESKHPKSQSYKSKSQASNSNNPQSKPFLYSRIINTNQQHPRIQN